MARRLRRFLRGEQVNKLTQNKYINYELWMKNNMTKRERGARGISKYAVDKYFESLAASKRMDTERIQY